jgi:hypothetical protein
VRTGATAGEEAFYRAYARLVELVRSRILGGERGTAKTGFRRGLSRTSDPPDRSDDAPFAHPPADHRIDGITECKRHQAITRAEVSLLFRQSGFSHSIRPAIEMIRSTDREQIPEIGNTEFWRELTQPRHGLLSSHVVSHECAAGGRYAGRRNVVGSVSACDLRP